MKLTKKSTPGQILKYTTFNIWPFFILMLCWQNAFGQTKDFPKDTSYTLHSAYVHIAKKNPEVTPVFPDLPKKVVAEYNVVYAQTGQRSLHLDIFYPKRKKPKGRSAVLLIHGGGWRSGHKEMEIPMAQQLAGKGFVAVTVEYRSSLEAQFPAAVYDLKAAVRWLRAHADEYGIDPTKIAAYGASAGAQLAAMLGTTAGMETFEGNLGNATQSSAVQAVLNIDGIVSFIHEEASAEGKMAGEWLGGSRKEAWDNWTAASPLEYADANTPPFLFVNSSHPRFHAGRDDLIKILDKSGTYSEVHTLPGSPHSFWTVHPWFEETLDLSVAFLRKVFK